MKQITLTAAFSLAMLWPSYAATTPAETEQVVVMPSAGVLLPSSERPWSPADYEAAAAILAHFPPEKLPAAWPEPTAVFLRIVNPENLQSLQDTNVPMYLRLIDARRFMIATAKITACYLPDMKQNQEHREDIARLEGFFLQEVGSLMVLVTDVESVPPRDFDSHAMLDPYVDKIKKDLDKIVGDLAESLEARQTRSPEARQRLARILADEYPHLSPFLSPDTRKKIELTLANIPLSGIASAPSPKVTP